MAAKLKFSKIVKKVPKLANSVIDNILFSSYLAF